MATPKSQTDSSKTSGKKKILLIEDSTTTIKLLQERLSANNYDVVVAVNGKEGLNSWIQEKPNLVLLDIMMPEMDGYSLLQQVKGNEDIDAVPVIIVTARNEMEELFKIEGASDYVVKPFDIEELLTKIKKYI